MRRLLTGVLTGAALVALAAAGCGGDGGKGGTSGGAVGGERQDYVDAIVASANDGGGISDEEVTCLAESIVDGVGPDGLREAGLTPASIRQDPDASPSTLGVELTTEQAEEVYDRASDCMDVRGIMVYAYTSGGTVPAEARDCIEQAMTDDLAQVLFTEIYTQADEAFADPGSDASVRYQEEIGPCLAMVGG